MNHFTNRYNRKCLLL